MPKRARLVQAILLVVIATIPVIQFSGCRDDSPTGSQVRAGSEGLSAAAIPEPKPLLEGWEPPAVALVLSGEQHGYLEPCGCSLTQSGGVSRRADLFRQIAERGWPVTGFDLGGTVKRSRKQTQYKFQTLLNALKDMHYTALGLGPEELRLGAAQLLARQDPNAGTSQEALSLLGANIVLFGSPDLGTPARQKVVEIGGVKIGVTAVLGTSFKDDVLLEGAANDITIEPPEDVLPGALAALNAESPDLLVLLSHGSLEESKALAQQFSDFDLVLSAGGPEDPDGEPLYVGGSMLVQVGHKGKYVGVVGFYPDDGERQLRFELVNLDNRRFQDSPQMQQHMQTYQDLLRDLNIAEEELPIPHASGASFVGAETCGRCHTKAYAKWKDSKHAHAFESLKIGREGQQENWISRIYDPECLSCHVTGWHPQDVLPYVSGYKSEEETPHLRGQQCENCHGPGSRHVDQEQLWKTDRDQVDRDALLAERKAMHLTVETARKRVCYQCHDLDNSPNFKFDEYWEKVKHPWRD